MVVSGALVCGLFAPIALAQGPSRERSLTAEGCPPVGRSLAKKIEDPALGMQGPDALGGVGDYLLMNERAAFIVSGMGRVDTYYYYGGILIDAVALEGCGQANPEQFEELALFVGELDPAALKTFGIRAFKGERVEVLNDGSDGGEAVVRVHGTDDFFWIVEFELMRLAYGSLGFHKAMTRPLGLELFVDYILPPDSAVLRVEFNLVNRDKKKRRVFTGAGAFFGDSTELRYYHDRNVNIPGFFMDATLPGLVSSGGNGAWAFGMEDVDLATMNLSGFNVFLNTRLFRHRIILRSAGKAGDSAKVVHYLAVGDSDFNSALVNLNLANPRPLKGWDIELVPLSGTASELDTGAPLQGVKIEIEMKNSLDEWSFIDGFQTGAKGRFSGMVPDLGKEYRLVASLQGRPEPEPIYFNPASTSNIDVAFRIGAKLAYEVKDGDGRGLPARIVLYRNGEPARTIYCRHGSGEALVVPGHYEVSVVRGYEYVPYHGRVSIEPGKTAELSAVLVHAVNTDGYLSADMHLHAGPSGDSKITFSQRIDTVAAEGLEVAVSTEHEAVFSWQPGVDETGLHDWVAVVTGEEVTATIPEHINMFPVEPRFDIDARGGPIKWYGMDIGEIYGAIRERGAGIVQLNHARNNCAYMCMIDYDRKTGRARLKHPEYIGLRPGDSLWSWNFDTIEYQNGNARVFMDPKNKKATGTFEDWMSFVNLGHRITAVANTDTHGLSLPGSPRTYFASPTDKPAQFQAEQLVKSLKQGKALASTGAFARVKIDGKAGMGDTALTTNNEVELWVHIESIPEIDVTHFKVFVNCDQVLQVDIPPTSEVVKYDGHLQVPISRDSQVVVLGFGKNFLPRGLRQFDPLGVPRFTTNPIYVDHGADGYQPPGWDGCKYTLP